MDERVNATFEIAKRDDAKRLVFGWASVAKDATGQPVVDAHMDEIPEDGLEEAAYRFMQKSRVGNEMHAGPQVAEVVESFVVTKDKLARLGLPEDSLPTGWWIGMRVSDDNVWKRVVDGDLAMFSIEGKARRTVVEDA